MCSRQNPVNAQATQTETRAESGVVPSARGVSMVRIEVFAGPCRGGSEMFIELRICCVECEPAQGNCDGATAQ